ncbi:Nucleoside-diphosphate-sugar epimerase [Candidatus Syntrophocurvum alkaliphilum]|uniref:Nucleoside-diphosphate-sugar epimerase n=1 Tax=Candidatus Syntrophocurvum alkaliphilum TaxID=2293317 RepID=A0A6I6DFV0_9FIRM|nr:NAD-dependent epimerase/dehydratase family protein [Candidatus Syntrophocurvum alkaliphilum]QGT99474.1 Nucleoside-diphosphate-sugar epimerase [Candidatus Syntrophocurvum alkaliphilum]
MKSISNEGKTALIVGATGLVGSELLIILLQSNEYNKVIIWVRQHTNISNKKLEEKVIDFEEIESYKIDNKVDHVYCCLGTTMKKAKSKDAFTKVDLHYPLALARWAKNKGVSQFLVVTTIGANANSMIFYNSVKGQLEEALCSLELNGLQIFRPSLLLGDRNELRLGEYTAAKITRFIPFIFKGPMKSYKPIEGKKVACTMYKVAKKEKSGAYIYNSSIISQIAENDSIS